MVGADWFFAIVVSFVLIAVLASLELLSIALSG